RAPVGKGGVHADGVKPRHKFRPSLERPDRSLDGDQRLLLDVIDFALGYISTDHGPEGARSTDEAQHDLGCRPPTIAGLPGQLHEDGVELVLVMCGPRPHELALHGRSRGCIPGPRPLEQLVVHRRFRSTTIPPTTEAMPMMISQPAAV